jgi:hypothetical protein
MSQATVRAALYAFFKNANIPGTPTILPEWPTEFDMAQLDEVAGQDFTSIIAVHLKDSHEQRISEPVFGGSKMREHNVGILIYYQYVKPEYPPAGEPYNTAWVDGLDQTIDAILTQIRTDPNGGNPSVIWQMGQDMGDLLVSRDLPRDNGTTIVSWNVVEFKLTEIFTA